MTKTTRGEFAGSAGMVRWQGWEPDEPASALVVIVHGLAEHGGRYRYVAERLADKGFAVYAPDHHGHGLSEGSRANIGTMDGVADDVGSMLAEATRRHPDVPRFLLGHSLGGLITLHYVTRRPVELAGVVLSGPALDTSAVSKAQRILAAGLNRVVPNFGALQLSSSDVSRDPAVVQDYDNDPLNYRGKIPVRTLAEAIAVYDKIVPRLPDLRLPLLLVHGTEDSLAPIGGSHLVAERVGSSDLTTKYYDGLYHEVLNEPEKDQVIDDVLAWLDAHR